MTKETIAIGVDIGGTHISAAPVNIITNDVLGKQYTRQSFDSNMAAENIFIVWAEVVNKTILTAGLDKNNLQIGIAMPGPVDYETGICLIKNQNKYAQLYNLNIKEALAAKLEIPISHLTLINDAAAFLQGEITKGASIIYNNPIGFTLGTGLGSAKLVKDEVVDADLWKQPFKDGIAEDYISARWILSAYKTATGRSLNNVKELIEIIEMNGKNEGIARDILDEFGYNIFLFINEIAKELNPGIVILGGNISKSFKLFSKHFHAITNNNKNAVPVVKSVLGEYSAIAGAATAVNKNQIIYSR